MLHAVALPEARDPSVIEEPVRAHPEDPLRPPELRLGGMERPDVALVLPVEVPPAGPIRGEVQVAGRAPRGLEDRLLAGPAGDRAHVPEGPVRREIADEELVAVPRHPRKIPFLPTEPGAVGGHPRGGVEVAARTDHDRRRRSVGRDRDELVHDPGRIVGLGMTLPNADQPATVRRDPSVRVPIAASGVGGDRHGIAARLLAVQALVREVREGDDSVVEQVRATAVFVDRGAHVEPGRRHVLRFGERGGTDQDRSPSLGRTAFEPVRRAVVDPRLHQEIPPTDTISALIGDRHVPYGA